MEKINKEKGKCDPNEVAVKSLFLGPAAENADWLEGTLKEIFFKWFEWRRRININDSPIISSEDQLLPQFMEKQSHTREVIRDLLNRFEAEIPKFSPRYIGHMFSEVSMPALLGHFITLLHNPNNISPEASKVGTEIESEAVNYLKKLVGFNNGCGHFTSGGTVANFEFLFRARERWAIWLATALATGSKDVMLSSHMGWAQYDKIKSGAANTDVAKFYLLDRYREAYDNIKSATGLTISDPVLLVPCSKHYSWPKAMHYLGLGESNIRYLELDSWGRATTKSLKEQIELAIQKKEPILGVVGVAGTTELGTVDPINEFIEVLDNYKKNKGYNIWLHIDGAYGGFFRSLIENTSDHGFISEHSRASLRAIEEADSVTLDPHKLGYVPYASGAFVCRNERNYFIRSFTGPYIVSEEKNVGNYTLEGSRSAAGAVATYTSIKSFNSIQGYAKILKRTLASKNDFQKNLQNSKVNFYIPGGLDTNILCFIPMGRSRNLSEINQQTLRLYYRIHEAGKYWISKTTLSKKGFHKLIADFCNSNQIESDTDDLVLLRLTLMNPFIISKESTVDHVASFCKILENEFIKLES
ncbi:MAG: hypothetical protein H6625_11835 [Bdellovibrionaceae bacterium]|nr:hypothetical protein [Pseudobdellovibrionaceae bacterium]